MTTDTATPGRALVWHKSSYSGNAGGQCVEVATACSVIHVRDSKSPNGPRITTSGPSWANFLEYAASRSV
ncbi:DUF397 domain-containing protein [Streptomyces noursei]|uniref:DUF397 domain-containing protein n=1 Tax=Streptomyces noursei TaxID=1971 RepID=UPI00081C457C|nr:protein of unknown function (DUF397) [Streptomyces noursei ATCC 11455]ANZ21875.1 protein of unknown function (DUF397) [Streptomyces noursei ATCC 11455]MCZ0996480.1 DUF397 domain-containing protein [Streptomyces noursei]